MVRRSRARAVLAAIGGVGATLVLTLVVVIALLSTGGTNHVTKNAPLIAAVIALGGVGTAQMVSIALEARRSHEAALQNYLEQVGELLTDKELLEANLGDKLSTVARAQTLAVLEGLDPHRKRILLQFLFESGLINKGKPVVSLLFANLREAALSRTFLVKANLNGAELRGADLSNADLTDTDLSTAPWSIAEGREGSGRVPVNLREADLSRSTLERANLHKAELRGADLSGADLTDTDLSEANLSGAKGVTNEQLSAAISLEGATMPDGQTLKSDDNPDGQSFDDWLKHKKAREEGE